MSLGRVDRHRRQLHAAVAHRGLRARHRAVGGAGLGPGGRRLHRGVQAAQLLPPPVRRGRLLGRLRAAVRRASCRATAAPRRSPSRARRMPACWSCWCRSRCCMMIAMPAVIWLLAPGLRRRPGDLRPGGHLRPHHLSLSGVHLARLALWRRAEQHRPLRRGRLHAGAAQHHADRLRARPDAVAARCAATPPRSAWRWRAFCNGCGCCSRAGATASP